MATVLCTKLLGFLEFVENFNPVMVFGFIQHLHGIFDDIQLEFNAYKVDIVGDSYIVSRKGFFTNS
jgi:Adenylate and Guanylate cyclase catalytic domain